MTCSKPNLFIGIETDADFAMFDVWMLLQIDHCLYNFSNASLVICT